jgi:hypothetical protein
LLPTGWVLSEDCELSAGQVYVDEGLSSEGGRSVDSGVCTHEVETVDEGDAGNEGDADEGMYAVDRVSTDEGA